MFSSIKRLIGKAASHIDDVIEMLEFSLEILSFIKTALKNRSFA